MFREWHKNEWQPWRIESETQTGSFNIRMPNGTVCGAYPEDIYKMEEQQKESQVNHHKQSMNSNELQEILKSNGSKIIILIIIVVVTVLYFRLPNIQNTIEKSPIEQKTQEISRKELAKWTEYKIQKESREKQRDQSKIEKESIERVKVIDSEINKLKKEVYIIIK